MKVDNAGDLVYWTYFMVDWNKVKQVPSDVKCADCGRPMNVVEPITDSKGQAYDGYVCHADKRVVWVKSG